MLKYIRCTILKKFFRCVEDGDITMEELLKKQAEGAEIVDVRSRQEYNENHIPRIY